MSDKFLFARLNNQNYQVWKTRMEMFLKREDTWCAVGDPQPQPVTPEWTRADVKAHAAIALYVEDSQLNLIRGAVSAEDAWTRIKDFHEKTTMTSRVSILRRICSLNMAEGGDVEQHLVDLEELFDRLSCAGLELEVPLKIAMIYRSLPDSFMGLVTAMESRPDGDQTIELVKQKLLDEHQRRLERSTNTGENALKLQSGGRKEKVCYHCRKPGHFRRDCRQLKQQEQQEKKSDRPPRGGKKGGPKAKQAAEADVTICFMAGDKRSKDGWFVDSGCSTHMTNKKAFFTELNENVKIRVVLADGSTTTSAGVGEGVVKCVDDKGVVSEIVFKDVLYVPDLDSALLSVRKLTQKGLKVKFGESRCTISTAAGKAVAVAELRGNLYMLKEAEEAKLGKEARHLPNCQHTWHRRFGHRDPAVLDRINADGLCDGVKVQDCGLRQVCEHCLEGKSSRVPFPKMSYSRAERVLDLIHTDVCGPMKNITPGGCRYLMTLIDDHSRYTVVCLLRQKSDAAACIKRFVAHVKTRFGRAPCVIRSDGGGEYANQELKTFYEQEGIEAQFTAAYSPQQNGIAERKNRSLQEMATCMLLDADLSKRFWGEAVATAAYLQNRLPSRAVERTPYEAWFGKKPSLSGLRIFGSPAYVHIPDNKRSKLDSKAQRLLFVGYCDDRKAYRFLDPKTSGITISRDARFIELGDGSLMPCAPTPGGSDLPKPTLIQEEVAINDPEELAIIEPQIEEETEARNESDEEFYGWDEEPQRSSEQASDLEQRTTKRSTRGVLPKRFDDYEVDVAMAVREEPASYEEAVSGSEQDLWKAAMTAEYKSLMKNDTWTLEQLPTGRVPISCKWVFRKKEDSAGNVTRFKARLVARGFSQQHGVDYDAVFAPVATLTTFRILLTAAGHNNMVVRHIDVESAYLHGRLQEVIYMQQPKGFIEDGKENLVCRLRRSLYGLKQAARVWNTTISGILTALGFVQSRSDPCLYSKELPNGRRMYLLIYVDDMLVASADEKDISDLEKELSKKITLTSLGEVSHFLGVRVTKDNGFYSLDQAAYIQKVANRFGLEKAKGSNIPIDAGYYRSREGSKKLVDNRRYHSLVGALLYVTVNTRPDVAVSVSILSRQVSCPTEVDWTELKRVVRYLLKTSNYKLRLATRRDGPMTLIGYSDADWSGDTADRKSNTGYLFQLGEATVCWASRKQTSVSLSSMEAEYFALSEACKEVVWLRRLLEEIGEKQGGPTVILEDNRSCIDFVKEERLSRRSKHIDTRLCYTRDLVEKAVVVLQHCSSENMTADILTKPLCAVKQKRFAEKMGLFSTAERTYQG